MRTPVLPAAFFVAAVFATAVQPPDILDEGPQPPPGFKGGKSGGPPPGMKGGPGGESGGSPAESPRMGKLKQLTFDRRPSAILKTWAPLTKIEEAHVVKTPLDVEIDAFQLNVVRGDWAKVKAYLTSLPDEEAIAAYRQMLQSLRQTPSPLPGTLPPGAMIQPN